MNYVVEIEVQCPFCGEVFPSRLDAMEGTNSMIEDCAVCCHPIQLVVECDGGEVVAVEIGRS